VKAIQPVQRRPRLYVEVQGSIEPPRFSPRKLLNRRPDPGSFLDTGEFKLMVGVCMDRRVKTPHASNGDVGADARASHLDRVLSGSEPVRKQQPTIGLPHLLSSLVFSSSKTDGAAAFAFTIRNRLQL
jgi:hypothetical protein